MSEEPEDITALLQAWSFEGDAGAEEALMHRLYPQLRRLAQSRLREQGDVSLQATELVHELYFRLLDQRRLELANRSHFFAICGRLMRRVLLDHVRHRGRRKRGGDIHKVQLEEAVGVGSSAHLTVAVDDEAVDVLTLEAAIERLEAVDPLAVKVVEMRYFAGMSHDETAEALDVGRATVGRTWRFARAFLRSQIGGDAAPSSR